MNKFDDLPIVYWFKQLGVKNLNVAGGKGANLGECFNAGLPVPPGFVVGTEAYRLAVSKISAQVIQAVEARNYCYAQQLIRDLEIPNELKQAVEEAYVNLGEPVVAVRSSATAEDLAEASFAGQQDSLLGIQGVDKLWDAIRHCWASLWSERAVEYRAKQKVENDGLALAVVVQQMIEADVAGVLFTQNPMANDDHMLLNASYGLGESVVSAQVTPDIFEVSRSNHEVVSSTVGAKETRIDLMPGGTKVSEVPRELRECLSLGDSHIAKLVKLGLEVERFYESPQDVEWAFKDDELYLLQSRPITTVVTQQEAHGEVSNRIERALRDDLIEHYPAPYPLDLVAVHALQNAVQKMMNQLGLSAPRAESLIVGDDDGVIRVNAAAPKLTLSALAKFPMQFRKGMSHDPGDWASEKNEILVRRNSLVTRARDAKCLDPYQLDELLQDVLSEASYLMRNRFLFYLAPMMVWRAVANLQIKASGQSVKVSVEDLYNKLDYVTSEISSGITTLAQSARSKNLESSILRASPGDVLDSITENPDGEDFIKELWEFLDYRGARTAKMYLPFSNCSWRENPEQFLELIAVVLRADLGSESNRHSAAELVKESLPRPIQCCWEKTVRKLRALHVGREGSLYELEELFVVGRMVMAEFAERLVQNGSIRTITCAEFLYYEEVRTALREANPLLQEKVDRRRSKRGGAEAVWWSRSEGNGDCKTISGTPGSPGQVVGVARVIRSAAEFSQLKSGEILVCPFTDPTWTPLFSIAGGVVADVGGALSHAAIVAREYGIPAVLGTGTATLDIENGDRILVDGTSGQVSFVD